jgi:hypothetical protein
MSLDEIAEIEDPVRRALVAKQAQDLHSELSVEFGKLRRVTIRDLHRVHKMPQKEIAAKLGITVPAVSALALKADNTGNPATPHWYDRLPPEVATRAKRGPGGMSPDDTTASQDVVEAILKVMKRAPRSREGGTFRPADLIDPVKGEFGGELRESSIRVALRQAVRQGVIERVVWGEYALTSKGAMPVAKRRALEAPKSAAK